MEGDEKKDSEPPKRELLDVPSHSSIERTLLVGQQRPTTKPPISRPPPPGELLGRLQAFLPQMEQANREIQTTDTTAGFEEPSEDEGPVVELDLQCGVFDLKDDAAVSAAERALTNQGVAVETYGGDSDSSDSSDSDDSDSDDSGSGSGDDEDEDMEEGEGEAAEKKKKKGARRHPGIQEIS